MPRDIAIKSARHASLRITAIYLAIALLWIFFSDLFLALLSSHDPTIITRLQTIKGVLFVFVTGGLLYFLINRHLLALYQRKEQIARLNRIYKVLSGINGALLRIRKCDALLEEACRIATKHGGYLYTSIMLCDQECTVLIPNASAGTSPLLDNFLTTQVMLRREDGGPIWTALESSQPLALSAISISGDEPALVKKLFALGIGAVAIYPLEQRGHASGAILFASAECDAFDASERKLLAEVVADIGLGLDYIESTERADWVTTHDPLTSLPNRTLMIDRLQQAIMHGQENHLWTGVITIDIYRFHHINDTYGRDVGDRVLRAIGDTLSRQLGTEGFLARIASDVFVAVLSQAHGPAEIDSLTTGMLSLFPLRLEEDDHELFISVRTGGAMSPSDGDNAELLLERSEIALHSGKLEEKNTCTFYGHDVDEAMRRRHLITQELQEAFVRDEFRLVYQPIIRLSDGHLEGVETLLRWDNRHLGEVSPTEFIPIAEDSGHIDKLGDWVLNEGCQQHRTWLAEGHRFNLTINLAARQLLNPNFVQRLTDILSLYAEACDITELGMEITETDLLRDMERAVEVLTNVHERGVKIYLDDFGTGYSSLAYLNRLPVDKIKIDGSFTAGLPDDTGKAALVRSIIGMAHSLGLEVVAEGVETKEQMEMLKELSCDALQGYLFSRPLPANKLQALLGHDLRPV